MIIMLDADKTVIKAKDMIKGTDQVERVERAREGNFTLKSKEKALAEKDNNPITRITFIGHSAYEEGTNVQCYGGWEVEDFSDLLIERLEEANEVSGKKGGFTNHLTAIDLVGCFTGYISPTGKSFAGRVAERLLEAGFDIRVNAFTNRHLPHPHAISSMISMPSTEEGKFYIRGFKKPTDKEEYEKMKVVIAKGIDERDSKSCALAEIKEKMIPLEKRHVELEKKLTAIKAKVRGEMDGLTKGVEELEGKVNSKNDYSFSTLNKAVKSALEEATKTKSKWKNKVDALSQKIETINASQASEKEKLSESMKEIEKTVKEIRSNFFSGRKSSTANALQDLMDNKENTHSFGSLKNLLDTINKDATTNGSKWQSETRELVKKINEIAKSSRSEQEKLNEAFALINHSAKDIRGHFFGGSGSTIATRLEKILEKKQSYLNCAAEEETLSGKKAELKAFKERSDVKKLTSEHNKLKQKLNEVVGELNPFKKQEEELTQTILGVNQQVIAAKKKMDSFAVEIACTDNVRKHLDTHSECNFTQPVKDKQSKMKHIIQDSTKVEFFHSSPSSRTSKTEPVASIQKKAK